MRAPGIRRIVAALGGLLGLAHLALTPLVHAGWTIEALWFVGTGLAIVVSAGANFIASRAPDQTGRLSLAAINFSMSCFFAAAWLVLPGPQVIVGGALFFCLTLCSLTAADSTIASPM